MRRAVTAHRRPVRTGAGAIAPSLTAGATGREVDLSRKVAAGSSRMPAGPPDAGSHALQCEFSPNRDLDFERGGTPRSRFAICSTHRDRRNQGLAMTQLFSAPVRRARAPWRRRTSAGSSPQVTRVSAAPAAHAQAFLEQSAFHPFGRTGSPGVMADDAIRHRSAGFHGSSSRARSNVPADRIHREGRRAEISLRIRCPSRMSRGLPAADAAREIGT